MHDRVVYSSESVLHHQIADEPVGMVVEIALFSTFYPRRRSKFLVAAWSALSIIARSSVFLSIVAGWCLGLILRHLTAFVLGEPLRGEPGSLLASGDRTLYRVDFKNSLSSPVRASRWCSLTSTATSVRGAPITMWEPRRDPAATIIRGRQPCLSWAMRGCYRVLRLECVSVGRVVPKLRLLPHRLDARLHDAAHPRAT